MKTLLALAWMLVGAVATQACAEGDLVVSRAVKGEFAEVRERLVLAIELQGLVVDHASKVGEMLTRTAKDLGASRRIYGEAEVLQFCSAVVSRQMMETDAGLLAFCPYGIAVYTLASDPHTTYLAFRRPSAGASGAQKTALERVEALLTAIVDDAAR